MGVLPSASRTSGSPPRRRSRGKAWGAFRAAKCSTVWPDEPLNSRSAPARASASITAGFGMHGRAWALFAAIGVGTRGDEYRDELRVGVPVGGVVQGGHPAGWSMDMAIRSPGMHVRAGGKQDGEHCGVRVPGGCAVERREAVGPAGVDLGSCLQQKFRHGRISVRRGMVQRGYTALTPGVDVRARLEQRRGYLRVRVAGGVVQRGVPDT